MIKILGMNFWFFQYYEMIGESEESVQNIERAFWCIQLWWESTPGLYGKLAPTRLSGLILVKRFKGLVDVARSDTANVLLHDKHICMIAN